MSFAPKAMVQRMKNSEEAVEAPSDGGYSSSEAQEGNSVSLLYTNASRPLPRDIVSKYRKGTPRSRGGCVTCKARHVKCDETKPCCKRCHTTGRRCEYTVPPPKNLRTLPTDAQTPAGPIVEPLSIQYQASLDIPGNYSERRSFHYIQAKNLTDTFGRCEIDLWDSTMLAYSHRSTAVRTSLLALSSIYEVHESRIWVNDRTVISLGTLQKHAFAQYTKAVAEIIESLRASNKNNKNKGDRRAVLLSCLIFIWIEIMLSNFDTARWHLDSGINIINDIATDPVASLERQDPDDIYGALHRSFLRLKFQITVGLQATPMNGRPPCQAQALLGVDGGSRPVEPVHKPTLPRASPQALQGPNVELAWTLQGRLRQLERLRKADEEISKKPTHTLQETDRKRSLTYVYVKLSRAVLSLMTEARSRGADSLETSRYVEVINLIEEIHHRRTTMATSTASLDFGVNPPLFFTLRWCRDVTVKCRAYELLKAGLPREGLWYRDDIVAFVDQQELVWR